MKPFFEEHSGIVYTGPICRFPYPVHMHGTVEVICPSRGYVDLTIGNRRHIVHPGDCAVVFPMTVHGYNSMPEDLSGVCMIFPADTVPAFSALFQDMCPDCPLVPADRLPVALPDIISKIASLPNDAPDELKKAYIHLTLALILPSLSLKPNGPEEEKDTVRRVLEHLARHYTEPVSLNSLSEDLKISVSHLSHIFSQQLKINFRKYINILRIDRARQLLQTGMTLTEIGFACGFEDSRTFRRAFSSLQGMSPAEYRKLRRAGTGIITGTDPADPEKE